jgi:hypothetical protein
LPEAITRLRKQAGSHDKFAAVIGGPVSRQTIIGWEHGRFPKPEYRARLIKLGVSPELFRRRSRREEAIKRLDHLEAEMAEVRRLLEE